jgi:hypothetical protein
MNTDEIIVLFFQFQKAKARLKTGNKSFIVQTSNPCTSSCAGFGAGRARTGINLCANQPKPTQVG